MHEAQSGCPPGPGTSEPKDLQGLTPLPEWMVECLSRVFSSLADPTRLRILHALCSWEQVCVSDLAETIGLSISATSHQLRVLKDRDLVKATRKGRTVEYSLADEHVRVLLLTGLEHAREDCRLRP